MLCLCHCYTYLNNVVSLDLILRNNTFLVKKMQMFIFLNTREAFTQSNISFKFASNLITAAVSKTNLIV